MEELKVCRRCKESKKLDSFSSFLDKKVNKYYFRSYCKPCMNKFSNERRDKGNAHEKEKARTRAYHQKNKERLNKARMERAKRSKLPTPHSN